MSAFSDHGYGIDDDEMMRRHHDDPPDLLPEEDRTEIFTEATRSLVNALGGYEQVLDPDTRHFVTIYRPGDSVLPVLKDLKKLWRKDDTDDERTVARCMYSAGLMKELIGLVGECTERGDWGRKVALMAFDLIAALTWPIDVEQELKEINEEEGPVVTDYNSLLRYQVEYKAMLVQSETLKYLLILILPCFAKQRRVEKEERIISLGLHIIRNMLAIKDIVADDRAVGNKQELSQLQPALILQLQKFTFLDLILTLASGADKTEFRSYNMLVLDMMFLILRTIKPEDLSKDQKTAARDKLKQLLDAEKAARARQPRNTRHSRFGTTISVRNGTDKIVLHSQSAIFEDPGKLLDEIKKRRAPRVKRADELVSYANLSPESIVVLQGFTRQFLDAFNPFIDSVLGDIRMERTKVRPADTIRTLFVARFSVEYLLVLRTNRLKDAEDAAAKAKRDGADAHPEPPIVKVDNELPLGLVAAMTEMDAVRWVAARMRISMEDKMWTELQASVDCFSQMFLLLDGMASSSVEEDAEAAEILQNQLYYNGDILDASLSIVAEYKSQSLAYLESVVQFAYVLLRMLEKYSKNKTFMFIRKKKALRAKRLGSKPTTAGEAPIPEEYEYDEGEDESVPEKAAPSYAEHTFTFTSFEKRFAQEKITDTLLAYLSRYRTFTSNEQFRRVVGLMHRQAVKAQAEGLYFKVSTLQLFRTILDDKATLPMSEATRDLNQLITFILRKFFKKLTDHPFLMIEALTPKSRGGWQAYSGAYKSDDDDDGMGGQKDRIREKMAQSDIEFIKARNIPWSQQMGIAIAMVLKKERGKTWINEILNFLDIALTGRQEVMLAIEAARVADAGNESDDDEEGTRNLAVPTKEAIDKFQQHDLDPNSDELLEATKRDPHIRLMLRLLHLEATDVETAADQAWYLPSTVLPSAIEMCAGAVRRFLIDPPLVEDEKGVLRKVRPPAKAPRVRNKDYLQIASDDEDAEQPRRRKQNKKAEVQTFKSAAFIVDSEDEDEEEMAAFFAKEAQLRREQEALAVANGTGMWADGGRKRKRRDKGKGKEREVDGTQGTAASVSDEEVEAVEVDEIEEIEMVEQHPPRPSASADVADDDNSDLDMPLRSFPRPRTQRVLDPDDDDE